MMLDQEFEKLLLRIQTRQCEEQTLEVKTANKGCPDRLYDTFSSFSNQDDGGTIVFGLDERDHFAHVGVYDAQDLQKKLMEVGEAMTPVVRPVLSVFDNDGKTFVTAEIPPVDLTERPCYKTAKGRLKGSYIRVGDADKPMTEYEVYSYEAYRKKYRDDIRPVENASLTSLSQDELEDYMVRRKKNRPHFSALSTEQFNELMNITKDGKVTLSALLLFCPYPQTYFPQLAIIAARVPGVEIGKVTDDGQRFTDSKRIEGNLMDMLDGAVSFVNSNMRTAVRIDPKTGKRIDLPEYPMDAVREVVLNALVHRDYSRYTENMPIQLIMFSDRMVVRNPGGLYGRMTVDQLGKMQPDTRNPFLVTAMEALNQTENRYSGIPRIRTAMEEAGQPEPLFEDIRGEFSVTLYNRKVSEHSCEPATESDTIPGTAVDIETRLLQFCSIPRTRKEIADFFGLTSVPYTIKRYVDPLVQSGKIQLTIPKKPRSRNQKYVVAKM